MSTTEFMRREWDERARKNSFFYIASWRSDWSEDEFFQSGEDDYVRLVAGTLEKRNFASEGASMLELGCGAGRMTRSFARRFKNVTAVDISSEMLSRAQQLCAGQQNVSWVQGNGADLDPIPSNSFDFVFSYLVLQHLPHVELIMRNVSEMLRVLRIGGICLFQFNGTSAVNMNWKGKAIWGGVDALWRLRLRFAARALARLAGLDPEMAGRSWHGVAAPVDVLIETIRSNGGTAIEISGEGMAMAWCSVLKRHHGS